MDSRFRRAVAMVGAVCAVSLASVLLRAVADDHGRFEWSTPVNLGSTINSAAGDYWPFVSTDGRTLYFTVTTCGGAEPIANCFNEPDIFGGGFDLYVSHRLPDGSWGPRQHLGDTINTKFLEGAPSLTPDGRVMYFTSNRPGGGGGTDIWVSRRENPNDDFGWEAPEHLACDFSLKPGPNSASNDAAPWIFPEGQGGMTTLYFDSNRPGGPGPFDDPALAHNGNDIWASTLQRDGTFGPAALVANVNTPSPDRKPSISRNGLVMFLTSSRPGTLGLMDLWVSTRPMKSAPWSTPVNLGPVVNSTGNEAGPAISTNGKDLYFQSVRAGGFGAYDLYVTELAVPK